MFSKANVQRPKPILAKKDESPNEGALLCSAAAAPIFAWAEKGLYSALMTLVFPLK